MNKKTLRSLRAIVGTVVIAGLFTWAVSKGGPLIGTPVGTVPLFGLGIILVFLIQWLVYVPSAIADSEKYFDLTGALTYITITIFFLILTPQLDVRSIILGVLVMVWAARLGSFLFMRVRRVGKDDRFDERKQSKLRFLVVWTIQGLWVTVTASAAWAVITTNTLIGVDAFLIVGVLIWIFGFTTEVVADLQKNRFKANTANEGKFIHTGLWSRSRHPNYFGEILLWLGVSVIAFPVLSGWQYLTLVSPVFVALLLIKGSGIPLLEQKAEERWGGSAKYAAYREQTPILVPRIFKK